MKAGTYPTMEAYLDALAPPEKKLLSRLRDMILKTAPSAVPCISYGMPAFRYQGRMLVYFAAFTHHCSLFPGSKEVLTVFAKELQPFKAQQGTIQFTTAHPLPDELVQHIVRFRMKQNEMKAK